MDIGFDKLIGLTKGGPWVCAAHALAYMSLRGVACIGNMVHLGETWYPSKLDLDEYSNHSLSCLKC